MTDVKKKRKRRRNYSGADITYAKNLYFNGDTYNEIARKMQARTKKRCSIITISRWVKDYSWAEEKGKLELEVAKELDQEEKYSLAQRTEQHLKAFEEMCDVGLAGLYTGVKDSKQAADMINMGIRGERDVSMGLMHMSFISELIQILIEELKDPEMKERIINRLRILASKWGDR